MPQEKPKLRNRFFILISLHISLLFFLPYPTIASDKSTLPLIEFDEFEKDFGTIAEGENKEFEFIVMNVGGSELIVSHLRSFCDCVEVSLDKTIIQPSNSARVQGIFRSAGRWGIQEKIIALTSNASNTPEVSLKIHLNVESGIRVTPRSLSFGDIPHRSTATKKVKIEARLEEELKVKNLKIRSAKNVSARINRRKISPLELPSGKEGFLSEIDIVLRAENDSAGEFSGQLDIETNSPRNPQLQVLFSGEKTGDLEVNPTVVHFKNITPGQSTSSTATVKSLRNGPFKITGFDAGRLPLSIKKDTDKALEQHKIIFVFTAPEKPRRFYRGYVYLLTDHLTQKRIKVGVNAMIRRNQ